MGEYSGNHPRFSRKEEMIHDRELIYDTKKQLHRADEAYKHPGKQTENYMNTADERDMSGAYNAMGDPNHPAAQKATWDPKASDMSWPMRALNSFSGNIGNFAGGSSKGDVFRDYQRHSGPTGSVNVHGLKNPGANFFPVEGGKRGVNPKGEKLQGGRGLYSSAEGVVGDSDMDGDTMFHDYNQDGTMLGRGIRRVQNWLKS